MTQQEALYALKKKVPAAIDKVIAEKLPSPTLAADLKSIGNAMRSEKDFEALVALAQRAQDAAMTEPPVYDRLQDLIPMAPSALDDIDKAVDTAGKAVKVGGELLLLGLAIYVLAKLSKD
jgi:hypothetical protein